MYENKKHNNYDNTWNKANYEILDWDLCEQADELTAIDTDLDVDNILDDTEK